MVYFLYYFMMFIQALTIGLCIFLMLTSRFKKAGNFLGLFLVAACMPVLRYIMMNYKDYALIARMLVLAVNLIYAVVCFKDPLWKRIAGFLTSWGISIIADSILCAFVYFIHPEWMTLTGDINELTVQISFWGEIVLVFCYMLAVFAMSMIKNANLTKGYLPILLLPAIHIMVYLTTFQLLIIKSYSAFFYLGQVLLFIVEPYWIFEMVYLIRRTEYEKKMAEIKYTMDEEKIHYEKLESKRESLARLRHDMNNQIQAIQYLIEKGEKEKAGDMLRTLSEYVDKKGDLVVESE